MYYPCNPSYPCNPWPNKNFHAHEDSQTAGRASQNSVVLCVLCVTGLDEFVSWENGIDEFGVAQLPELGEIGFPLDFHGAGQLPKLAENVEFGQFVGLL